MSLHVPAHAAVQMMRQHQDRRQPGGRETAPSWPRNETARSRPSSTNCAMRKRVVGVALGQDRVGAADAGVGGGAESSRAGVLHERVAGDMVAPARAPKRAGRNRSPRRSPCRTSRHRTGRRRPARRAGYTCKSRPSSAPRRTAGVDRAAGGVDAAPTSCPPASDRPRNRDSCKSSRCSTTAKRWRSDRPHRPAPATGAASRPAPRCRCSAARHRDRRRAACRD